MDTNIISRKFAVALDNSSVGLIEVNNKFLKKQDYTRPFIRKNDLVEIVKYGARDYEKLDSYIITSLNDYYNKLMSSSPDVRAQLLNTYKRLYSMWQDIHNFKSSNKLKEMDKSYDLLSYELYVLGYVE